MLLLFSHLQLAYTMTGPAGDASMVRLLIMLTLLLIIIFDGYEWGYKLGL